MQDAYARRIDRFFRTHPRHANRHLDHPYFEVRAIAARYADLFHLAALMADPDETVRLQVALRLPEVAYIGAMGSRRTHEDRVVRLKEAGLTDEEIARIHSPIGLDLGARTPEETAISIAAEIVQDRWGGSGGRLKNSDGPIHAGAPR